MYRSTYVLSELRLNTEKVLIVSTWVSSTVLQSKHDSGGSLIIQQIIRVGIKSIDGPGIAVPSSSLLCV